MFDRNAITKGRRLRPPRRLGSRRRNSGAAFWTVAVASCAAALLLGWDPACAYMAACTGVGGPVPGAVAVMAGGAAAYFFALANSYADPMRALLAPAVGIAVVLAVGAVACAAGEAFGQAEALAPAAAVVVAVIAAGAYLLFRMVRP